MSKKHVSTLTRRETVFALAYLPLHAAVLPRVLSAAARTGRLSTADINFFLYAFGASLMLMLLHGFFRRDFDVLCDRPVTILLDVVSGYFIILALNYCVSSILLSAGALENPNNAAVIDLLLADGSGRMNAMAIFLAPLVEEPLFRGGLFGTVRRYSRAAAYAVTVLLFAVYHEWQYLAADPRNFIYLLQYVPAGFMLCRCYERTESIWTPVFLHMLFNGMSVWAVSVLRSYL